MIKSFSDRMRQFAEMKFSAAQTAYIHVKTHHIPLSMRAGEYGVWVVT